MAQDQRQLLEELDSVNARARRQAVAWAWGFVATAALAVAGLVYYGGSQLSTTRTHLADLRVKVVAEQGALGEAKRQRGELEKQNQKLREENANLALVKQNYLATAAPESERHLTSDPAAIGPDPPRRAYLHIGLAEDRTFAERIGAQLGGHGFQALGVELIESASRLKVTEVRYYKKSDERGATRLVDALKTEGVPNPALLYLNLENNTRVRPNHYEIWFAAGAGGRGNRPSRPDR